MQTATFDASLGNTEGGVTNLVLKSGTNQFHGEGYYVKTPRSMFANDYFANASNIPLSDFSYTRWAASAFGPIVRNKTFFTYGYESIPEARPRNNGTPSVPTDKMRNGDFSELLALGSSYQLYNPFTARLNAAGRVQRDPFVGNIIPRELMNPVALNVLDYIARPRTAGGLDGSGNFQRPEMKEETEYGSHTVRIDHNLTQNQRMFGRVSWYDRNSNYNNYFDNLSTGQWFRFISRQVALDHVWTMNSTTVLNVRYGFDRFTRGDQGNPANYGFDLTELGFPASYANATPADIRKFPRFDIAGYQGTGVNGEDRPIENQTFIATVNKVMGGHSFRTGVEYRRYQETSIQTPPTMTGQFNFGDTWVRGPLDNSPVPPRGGSVAAFLLGLPENSSFVQRAPGYEESSSTTGHLSAGRLAGRLAAHAEPWRPLGVRDSDGRSGESDRAWLRCRRVAGFRGTGPGGIRREPGNEPDSGAAASTVQRARRAHVPGRQRRARGSLRHADDQHHAAPGLRVQAQ